MSRRKMDALADIAGRADCGPEASRKGNVSWRLMTLIARLCASGTKGCKE